MIVRDQLKSEVVAALRRQAEPYRDRQSNPANQAAYANLTYQAEVVQAAPGETTGEAKRLLGADISRLKKRERICIGLGLGLFAATGASMWAAGSAGVPTWRVLTHLTGMVGGVGFIVAGGMTGDKVSARRSTLSIVEHWEKQMQTGPAGGTPATSPPPTNLLRSELTAAAPQNQRSELVSMLNSTGEYLQARVDQPGHAAALAQVRGDRARIEQAPGETLAEMRALAEQDSVRSDRLSKRYVAGALAAFGVALGLGFLGGPGVVPRALMMAGAVSGVVLAVRGGTLQDHRGRNNALIGTINNWEMQLDGLKAVAGSEQAVRRLADGPEQSAIQVSQGYVQVGGIRVPVRRERAGEV